MCPLEQIKCSLVFMRDFGRLYVVISSSRSAVLVNNQRSAKERGWASSTIDFPFASA